MDHAEALRLIEEASLEPGGIDALASGDSPGSSALIGHLAGCPDCSAEFAAVQRTAQALRLVAEDSPSVDLRERTLALVAAVGRHRGAPAEAEAISAAGEFPDRGRTAAASASLRRRFGVLAIAAGLAFALLAAGSFVAADLQIQLAEARHEAAQLRELYGEVEALLEAPTTRAVALDASAGSGRGTLLLDARSQHIAVLGEALPPPGAGREYRCWLEVDGARQPVGRMWWDDGLAYWAGTVEGASGWPAGATFGVSLEAAGEPGGGPPVLTGKL